MEPSAPAVAENDVTQDMVLYEVVEKHIAKITLNRPERRNAMLVPDMQTLLIQHLTEAQEDDRVKVIVLSATGPHFCAGEDVRRVPVEAFGLKKGARAPQSLRIRGISKAQLNHSLMFSDKAVIAACRGACLGLGFLIPLCCDLIIASETARFSRLQHRLGFAGMDMILPVVLMRLGMNRGYEAMLTGRTIPASELREWGVVSSLVPDEKLEDEAMRYARAIAAHSTDGLMIGRQAKKMFWNAIGMGQWEAFVNVAHPLFTNLVWREDEYNMLRVRNEHGPREALRQMHKIWEDLGFA